MTRSGEEEEAEEGDRRDKVKRVRPSTSVTLTRGRLRHKEVWGQCTIQSSTKQSGRRRVAGNRAGSKESKKRSSRYF